MASEIDQLCQNKKCKQGENGVRKVFQARTADVKRGWGKFCCKSCKAQEQESRTHQYANHMDRRVNAVFHKPTPILEKDEFFANFSNEDNEDIDDWAYDESDWCY